MNKENIIRYVLLIQFVVILILLFVAFGVIVVYSLILLFFVSTTAFFAYVSIIQSRNLRAAEVALQYVFDQISLSADQIDEQIKGLVWAEDVPEVRKVSALMHEAKRQLLNAPVLFNGTVIEEIYAPPSEEELKTEEQIRNAVEGQLDKNTLDIFMKELSEMRKK